MYRALCVWLIIFVFHPHAVSLWYPCLLLAAPLPFLLSRGEVAAAARISCHSEEQLPRRDAAAATRSSRGEKQLPRRGAAAVAAQRGAAAETMSGCRAEGQLRKPEAVAARSSCRSEDTTVPRLGPATLSSLSCRLREPAFVPEG